ncbi:MAG: hypothetical protein LBI09_00725 [Nitrososphaerota archaeon]|jgi:hypothetical protein|nr:hypothetical protein [Nitrososphaerota archaeon]
MVGRSLSVDHFLVDRWIQGFVKSLPEPKVVGGIVGLEFDVVWHFVGLKKTSVGCLKQLIAEYEKLLLWVFGRRNTAM